MFACEFLMAFTLLTSPEGSVNWTHPPPHYNALRPTLQKLALQLEIMDPRETRYVLARMEDFRSDLQLLRRRYRTLADAPPLEECKRLPERCLVNDLLAFNRTYHQYLTNRQPVDLVHGEEVQTAMTETDRLYQVWDTVRDARCTYYYVTVRRQALKQLRCLLGEEAFYRGHLPPHVPVWRIPEVD
jgi:hypothetical protein